MKKLLPLFAASLLSISLIGCATQEQTGMLVGGALGGLVGSQFGSGSGRAAAAVAGTLVGGWLGGRIARSMDQQSRMRAEAATQRAIYSNQPQRWSTAKARGIVTPQRTYRRGRTTCRRYKSTVWIGGQPEAMYGRACLINGRWRAVS